MPKYFNDRKGDIARLCEAMVWSDNPEAITQKTVDAIAEIFNCQYASIHLLDISGDFLVQYYCCYDLPRHVQTDTIISISTGRMRKKIAMKEPLIMDFLNPDPVDQLPENPMYRSTVSVPLLANDEMRGMFTVVYEDLKDWSDQDLEYMVDIGRIIGITIQHAHYSRKTIALQILLERKRLSGELHDHLAQLGFPIGAFARSMPAETALCPLCGIGHGRP